MAHDDLISIGELSRRTNLATSALRYYEELELLEPAARVSGQRRYSAHAVDVVGLILFLRDVGFTLGEIAEMMRADPAERETWRALARRKMNELDDVITKAIVARHAIDHALRCRHGDVAECPTFWRIVRQHQAGDSLAAAHSALDAPGR